MNPASYPTTSVAPTDVPSTTHGRPGRAAFSFVSCLTAIKAKVTAGFDRVVPFGYQDANGFHHGEQPAPDQSNSTPPLV